MPEIVPLRGVRFDPERTPPGSELCPPYDVIDAADHARLLAHHEHNAVRIVLGDDPAQPRGDAEEYRRRGAMVRAWLAEGVLRRDERPGYYLYELEYTNLHRRRARYRGVLGAARARPWGEGVLRHEEIRPKVVDDRFSLLKESGVDSGVVQLVEAGLDAELAPFFAAAGAPVLDAKDWRGDRHRLRILSDPERTAALSELLAPRRSVVADGHHRYTTALRLGSTDRRPGAGHVLTIIGDLAQDGLRIEPTHRILRLGSAERAEGLIARIVDTLDEGSGEPWRLERRGEPPVEGRTPIDFDEPTFARRIAQVWEELGELEIENWHDLPAARRRLEELADDGALLCALPPVSKEEFWERCGREEVFPPKTTYFEPKIGTGLVLRLLEEELS